MSKKDNARLVEWKAQFALMWVESNPIFVMIFLGLKSIHQEDLASPIVFGPIVGLSVLMANRRFFRKGEEWNVYLHKFSEMSKGFRVVADLCVACIVVLSVFCPIFIFPH